MHAFVGKAIFIQGGYQWPYLVAFYNDVLPPATSLQNVVIQDTDDGSDAAYADCTVALAVEASSGGGSADLSNKPVTFSFGIEDEFIASSIALFAAGGGGDETFDAKVEVTGILRYKVLNMFSGTDNASMSQLFCKKSCTVTVLMTYTGGYNKRFFPIVNGIRKTWSDSSADSGDIRSAPVTKTFAVVTGDYVSFGQEISSDYGVAWSPAYSSDSCNRVSQLDATQDGRALGEQVKSAALSETLVNAYLSIMSIDVYADTGVPWHISSMPGVVFSKIQGSGPATIILDTSALSYGDQVLGTFSWTATIFGKAVSFTRQIEILSGS
jgi:hypothetical protein